MPMSPQPIPWIDEIKRRLCLIPREDSSRFEGCTPEEIVELEEYAGGKLPLCYRQFLEHLGRDFVTGWLTLHLNPSSG
jgi:hypothetical protein